MYKKHNTPSDKPYWRGQVWVNINYLALQALGHYAQQPGPHRERAAELHATLRTNLLEVSDLVRTSEGYGKVMG